VPETISPASVSRTAFVSATPGRKIIMDPIITELILEPRPEANRARLIKVAAAQQLNTRMKRLCQTCQAAPRADRRRNRQLKRR
jgi:hypothetical protein